MTSLAALRPLVMVGGMGTSAGSAQQDVVVTGAGVWAAQQVRHRDAFCSRRPRFFSRSRASRGGQGVANCAGAAAAGDDNKVPVWSVIVISCITFAAGVGFVLGVLRCRNKSAAERDGLLRDH